MAAEAKRQASISTTTATDEASTMLTTKRKPATRRRNPGRRVHGADGVDAGRAGRGDGRAAQARQRTVQRPSERDRGDGSILARVFGNSPDFWLNVQRRSDLWEAMHPPRTRADQTCPTADSRRMSPAVVTPARPGSRRLPGFARYATKRSHNPLSNTSRTSASGPSFSATNSFRPSIVPTFREIEDECR